MKKQSLILAVILALGSVLSSCGSETTGQTGTTTAADEATAAEETTSRFVADELPELNFGGITMNVVVGDYFGAYWDDLYAEEATRKQAQRRDIQCAPRRRTASERQA